MMHRVFVYGTLRRGESNHHLLASANYLGEMTTEAVYVLYDLGPYPAMIPSNSDSAGFSVIGEVFEVDDIGLSKLDELEEIPILYRRETLETPYGKAWVYLYQDEDSLSKIIITADWCHRD